MKSEVKTVWTGEMSFEAEVSGHKVRMDTAKEDGGQDSGARPKALLLAALGGCSGMDVVSILKKMREPCTWFEMVAQADTREEHPKKFTAITIIYRFKKSDQLNHENVKKACQLSQDKYCGVSAMLKDTAPLAWEIEYL